MPQDTLKTSPLHTFILSALLCLSLALILSGKSVSADDEVPTETVPIMPEVLVEAERITPTTGMTILDKEIIESLPTRNGSLTELLFNQPGVQFSESFENSTTAGEIRPPEISISGGRPEDNNFIIDSMGNNSLLDPAYDNFDNADNVPGHSQELFLLDHLVENVSVLRANIPARYGGFTGGVVIAETIDPTETFGGQISYRMTNSAWGKFHLDTDALESFENSTSADYQPHFTKSQFSSTLNAPFKEEIRFLIDYSLLWSRISLNLFDSEKEQQRKNENLLLKLAYTPQSDTKISLSAMYAPYEGKYYLENAANSDYTLKGGGYKLNGRMERQTTAGEFLLNLAFQQSENSRSAPNNYWTWKVSPSKDWGELIGSRNSLEGYYGDIEKSQKSISANLNFDLNPFMARGILHELSSGIEMTKAQATYDRTEPMTRYIAAVLDSNVICEPNSPDCISGEQFFWYKNYYPSDNAEAEITSYSTYIEDTSEIKRLTLRAGLRATYNTYQKNTDVAPRLATAYDFFTNNRTILTSGYNRYYGAELLTLKLEEQKLPYEVYSRSRVLNAGYPEPWPEIPTERSSINTSRVSKLETPYADEWNLGLKQSALGGLFDAIYIERKFREQIRAVTIDEGVVNYKEWRNSGRKDYEELSLSWQKKWQSQQLFLNISWQSSHSNSNSYTDSYNEDQLDLVGYNGELVRREDLPTDNYSRPVKASVLYTVRLPKGFSFSNVMNYRGRYKALMDTRKNTTLEDGYALEGYDIYAVVKNPSATTFDWNISWASPCWWQSNNFKLTLDILNVFDKRNHYGPEENNYLLGRQIWAGVEFNL